MKRMIALSIMALSFISHAKGEMMQIWTIFTSEGTALTQICEEPSEGDQLITAENQLYRIISIDDEVVYAEHCGMVELPDTNWMDVEAAFPVSAQTKRIGLYCTHSDESFEPSDGFYSTMERGSIYQVADHLAEALMHKGIDATVSEAMHHPHDAGAYRRSRQTAIQLLKTTMPDCLIDIHRDGIPDPASYAVTIAGRDVSKIRLLVGRGNQNAEVNKDFALMIKAVADRVYPGLIKDIYMGKGAFNQDLLPKSILFECGTYTLEIDRVISSMPMMADVLNRALYGGVVGSAGKMFSDVSSVPKTTGGTAQGKEHVDPNSLESGVGSGVVFLVILLVIGLLGFAVLATGSLKRGTHKAGRNLSEMTGGILGTKPTDEEEHEHS